LRGRAAVGGGGAVPHHRSARIQHVFHVELRRPGAGARQRAAVVAGRAQPRLVRLRALAPARDGRDGALTHPHGRGRRRRRHPGAHARESVSHQPAPRTTTSGARTASSRTTASRSSW
jgi:hypothetical protein